MNRVALGYMIVSNSALPGARGHYFRLVELDRNVGLLTGDFT